MVSAVLSVFVQRRVQKNEETADDDCKEAKKRREDENRRRLSALWLFFSALLFALQMVFYSAQITHPIEFPQIPLFFRTGSSM